MVTEIEKRIAYIFRDRLLTKETAIGYMLALRKYDACDEMLEWLEKNKQANSEDIGGKIIEIIQR